MEISREVIEQIITQILTEKMGTSGYPRNDVHRQEIAGEFGITRQAVHDMIRRCDKILADYEARLHLVAKFLTAKEKIKEIHTLSRRLLKEDKEQMEEDIRQIESVCNQVLEDL